MKSFEIDISLFEFFVMQPIHNTTVQLVQILLPLVHQFLRPTVRRCCRRLFYFLQEPEFNRSLSSPASGASAAFRMWISSHSDCVREMPFLCRNCFWWPSQYYCWWCDRVCEYHGDGRHFCVGDAAQKSVYSLVGRLLGQNLFNLTIYYFHGSSRFLSN